MEQRCPMSLLEQEGNYNFEWPLACIAIAPAEAYIAFATLVFVWDRRIIGAVPTETGDGEFSTSVPETRRCPSAGGGWN